MKASKGFTLIEILIALMILGIVIAVAVPRFSAGPTAAKKLTIELNKLMQSARYRALEQQQIMKITLDAKADPKKMTLAGPDNKILQTILWPGFIEIADFYFDKKRGQGTEQMWYFVGPDGIAQEVIFNVIDTQERAVNTQAGNYGLVLNPFTCQFKLYDTFQNP